LQHHLSKLWSYSGLADPSRISDDLIEKRDIDKRVRSLTKLTKEHAATDFTASFFDSTHPLPEVCIYYVCLLSNFIDLCFYFVQNTFLTYSSSGPCIPCLTPSSSEGGPLPADLVAIASEAPKAEETQDGDETKDLEEGTNSTASPPAALSEDTGASKKRKRVDKVASSSTSAQKTSAAAAPCLEEGVEMFDLMDS
jgi:hypothetical protein